MPGVEFVLKHDRDEAPQQFSEDGDFVINNVEGKGIGNYSCSYHLQAHPGIWSESSDSLELVGAAGEWIIHSGPGMTHLVSQRQSPWRQPIYGEDGFGVRLRYGDISLRMVRRWELRFAQR